VRTDLEGRTGFLFRRRFPMAVLQRKSLVLCGVNVACGVVTGMKRFGVNAANTRLPAGLSFPGHLSTRTPCAEVDPRPRHERAASSGVGCEARRAGRPGSPAGVPSRRRPARYAGRIILSGWSQGYSQTFPRRAMSAGSLTSLPAQSWPGTRGEVKPASMPAQRMLVASIRGR